MWLWPNGLRVHFPLSRKHPLSAPQRPHFKHSFLHENMSTNRLLTLARWTLETSYPGCKFSQFSSVQISHVRLLTWKLWISSCMWKNPVPHYNVWVITSHYPWNIPKDDQDLKKNIYFTKTCVPTHKFKITSLDNSIQSYPCFNTGLDHSIKFLLQS